MLNLLRSGSLETTVQSTGENLDAVVTQLRAIEQELGARLFRFVSGSTHRIEPTVAGRRFLQRAPGLINQQRIFEEALNGPSDPGALRIFASHYLASYLLIDLLPDYQRLQPDSRVRVSVRTEQQILGAMLQADECSLGLSAPVEFPEQVEYRHWFDMSWFLVVPDHHPLAGAKVISLTQLAQEHLILFEPGSTGRQHVLEAFHAAEVQPKIGMQATTTAIILQMIEAGLGVSILPLLPCGRTTADKALKVIPISEPIQSIQSGIFIPTIWLQDPQVQCFLELAKRCAL